MLEWPHNLILIVSILGALSASFIWIPHLLAWCYRDAGVPHDLLKTNNQFIAACVLFAFSSVGCGHTLLPHPSDTAQPELTMSLIISTSAFPI